MMRAKTVFIAAVSILALFLVSCENKSAAVDKQISEIGTVTLESEEAITAAEAAYAELSAEDQGKVENYDALVQARSDYETLVVEEQNKTAYAEGTQAMESGDYESAIEIFTSLGDYEDAKEKVSEAENELAYQNAVAAMDQGDYEAAAKEFSAISEFKDSAEKIFDCAVALFSAEDYKTAETVFDMTESDEKQGYLSYIKGLDSMEAGNYAEAKEAFEAAGDVEKASDMVNACALMEAKAYMDDGSLNSAKAILETLPEDCTYEDLNAGDCLKKLKKHEDFVALCGQWQCNSMTGSITQTHDSTGAWDAWDNEASGLLLYVKCVMNEDDTVTINASAHYWLFTNFAQLSSNLKTKEMVANFTGTGETVPESLATDNATLTMVPGQFAFDFFLEDPNASLNFTYTWKCNGVYTDLVKTY